MKIKLFIPLLLIVTLCSATPKDSTIVDLMPNVWKFEKKAKGKLDEQVKLFKKFVIQPNKELYSHDLFSPDDESMVIYLKGIWDIMPKLHKLHKVIKKDIVKYKSLIKSTFPDFDPRSKVYIMLSLSFDGTGQMYKGSPTFFLGLDGVAKYHGNFETLGHFFTHEMLHVYHTQVNPEISYAGMPLYLSLFTEGLANYTSSIICNDTTLVKILLDDTELALRGPQMKEKLSQLVLEKINSKDKKDYRTFFTPFMKQSIPNRSGYYLGYIVVKEMAKDLSLTELCLMEEAQVYKQVETILTRLSNK